MPTIDKLKLSPQVASKYSVVNDSFRQVVKNNPKDRISLEIGDSKQPDFKPQRKIMRWDNECNLSQRVLEDINAVVQTEGEKIKYVAQDYEVHQYDKPDASEEGGHQLDIILKTPANQNKLLTIQGEFYRLVLTTQYKNVIGYKQLPLTQQEIDKGFSFPENVINSIAFYHNSKGGMNEAGGMEYKFGKIGHQYRIKLTDANGDWIWADQNWLPETNEHELLFPKEWLDNAVYPVIVDPTFGYTSVGGGNSDIGYASGPACNTARLAG